MLIWEKHCFLSVLGVANNENDGANSNNIIFPKKTQYYMSLWSFYQQKTIKKFQNFLAKNLKDQWIGINITQKVKQKIVQMSIDILSKFVRVSRLFVLV